MKTFQSLKPFRLAGKSFQQLVHQPTHIEGGILDQLYVRNMTTEKVVLHHPYYTDHDAVLAMLETESDSQ